MRIFSTLPAIFILGFLIQTSNAAWPDSPYQEFSRWIGYGYGDGYHSCKPPLTFPVPLPVLGGSGHGAYGPRYGRFGGCSSISGCGSCATSDCGASCSGGCGGGCQSCDGADSFGYSPEGISPGHISVRPEPPVYGSPEPADPKKKDAGNEKRDAQSARLLPLQNNVWGGVPAPSIPRTSMKPEASNAAPAVRTARWNRAG